MFSPTIASKLRDRGYDVLAVADDPQLRAMADPDLLTWAADHGRRLVTENVRDFRPLIAESPNAPGVVFTSNRTFPRSKRGVGALIAALDHWLVASATTDAPVEVWLQPRRR